MADAVTYEELRQRIVTYLDAAIQAHESGDLEAIETDYEELDAELPRNAGPEFDKLHVAFEFWSGWIDARNHDWLYYPGIQVGDWPRLARGIVQDLQQNCDIRDELVLKHFDYSRQPVRTSLWARLKALFGVVVS